MKKALMAVVAAAAFTACNSISSTTGNIDTTITDTAAVVVPPADTMVTTTVYVPVEGDVIYRDKKVYVMQNGSWVEADHDITLDDGTVVYRNGTAKKDRKEIKLQEEEIVTKTGNFFDRTGHAIANAWDDTKDAVKDAGNAIGKTAKKVGREIDTTFSGKHRH